MSANLPGINIVTLGCSKNLVDSEYLCRQLSLNGFQVQYENSEEQDIVIINTCGFINDAKQESIETILEYAEMKKEQKLSKVYVMGCLSQRYKKELQAEIPEIDGFYGVYEQEQLLSDLNARYFKACAHQRNLATPAHFAYLKIAEGCDRKCSFCAIPYIKGSYRSKPLAKIEREASYLAEQGVKELNLIAQDTSYYGYDWDKKYRLPQLLDHLAYYDQFLWIRLLYAYPIGFSMEILRAVSDHPNICNYLDMPFQHISDSMLKRMRRGINAKQTYRIINLINRYIPDVTLRTTLLVGHPGETDSDFNQLIEFVREVQFDRLGVFTYSEEEGTHSAKNYKDDVPESLKQERANMLMQLQSEISYRKNVEKIGSDLTVLVDREDDQYYYGRTEADAPEVDNEVLISKTPQQNLFIGRFYTVTIQNAWEYDLEGTVKNPEE
jgi:ribosomal protein S12 methylthiotransferase